MQILQLGRGQWGINHFGILSRLGHKVNYTNDPLVAINEINNRSFYDACVITCSSENHFHLAKLCLEADIPVFCEKPVCTKPEELEVLKSFIAPRGSTQPCFMSGHQLVFMPELADIKAKGLRYMNSMRTAAIPRTEGAILSLAVHDISLLLHVAGYYGSFHESEISASGNHHTSHITIKTDLVMAEIYVAAFSHIRLRSTSFVTKDNIVTHISPDNWSRLDLLSLQLESFMHSALLEREPQFNNLQQTCAIMELAFRIREALKP